MASILVDCSGQQYACKCLNIRIKPQEAQTAATGLIADPDFKPIFVGDQGILIAHPQLTARTRTRGQQITGSSQCYRYTAITCLICSLLTYRVYQTYSGDVEGKDGLLLPTDDWVERDILKSSTGWIEAHKESLNGSDILSATSSSNYSTTFSLLLPPASSLAPPIEPIFERPPSPSSPAPPLSPPVTYLSKLRPLFLPPPFTPSHPIFGYLSSLATEESTARRNAAEQTIADLVEAKIAEIEQADMELKKSTESLWQKFRECTSRLQYEAGMKEKHAEWKGTGSPPRGVPRTTRNFTPGVISPVRSSPPNAPRISALSASLATSSFHHPKTQQSSPPASERPRSSSSNMSGGSSRSGSSTLLLPLQPPSEGSNVLKFRRNINDTINTEASFRYFVNLEEDLARHKEGRKKESQTTQDQQDRSTHSGGSSNATSGLGVRSRSPHSEDASVHPNEEHEVASSRGREKTAKGKRKVTFDVRPEVVTIKREVKSEREEEEASANQDQRDMIFEIEDLEEESSEQSSSSKPTLHLIEQPAQPSRPWKPKAQLSPGLSGNFSGLRPASLPAPSHIRPPRGQHGSDSSSSAMVFLTRPALRVQQSSTAPITQRSGSPEQTDIGQAQDALLKLVAADTPSHRGAWKPESKAWKTFVRRQGSKERGGSGDIPEEDYTLEGIGPESSELNIPIKLRTIDERKFDRNDEVNESDQAFVGSLPIPIKLSKKPPTNLSLASYQPTTNLSSRVEAPASLPKNVSSAAIRKANYAERDRSRSMDPGTLDFAAEEDELDEEADDEDRDNAAALGGRGRKRALKILQARSEVPEAGMWRSLAS